MPCREGVLGVISELRHKSAAKQRERGDMFCEVRDRDGQARNVLGTTSTSEQERYWLLGQGAICLWLS